MRAKKHVLVLMGGMSLEHDISMKSGTMVVDNLDGDTYKITPVTITRNGEWQFPDEEDFLEISQAVPKLKVLHPDCVFIALHGPYGEDGRIQGMLDLLGIPYTGSGCAGSAFSLDKIRAKILVEREGITVADQVVFTHAEWSESPGEVLERIEAELGFPCVVKNPIQGSSLGMGIPQNAGDFRETVQDIVREGLTIMVERFIPGLELTCGVLDVEEDDDPVALPVTSIKPGNGPFFDFHDKYTPGASEETTPAEIPDNIREWVQDMSVRAHIALDCRGFSRSDMILNGDEVVWLELNTIPGLTETSLYPQGAAAAGMTFSEMLTKLVDAAFI